MNWTYKTTIALSMLAITGVTVMARPVIEPPVSTIQTNLSKKVSAKFENAPVKEVMAWLAKQGISFVSPIENDRRLSLNLQNQPLKDALDAIAFALGGSWSKKGDVFAFQGGGFVFSPKDRAIFERDMEKFGQEMKAFKWEGKNMKELEGFSMPDMKEFKVDIEKLHKELGQMKEFKMDPKALKELKGMHLGPDSKEFKLHMEKLHKELGDMKGFKMDPKALMELKGMHLGPDSKEFKLHMEKLGQELGTLKFKGQDLKSLLGSISETQWEKHRAQGHLKVSDLTAEQKKMLGLGEGTADIMITIVMDGKELKIQGK